MILFLLVFLWPSTGKGQVDSTSIKKNSLVGLPIVFLTPETSWGFGGAGVYTFRLDTSGVFNRPSQIQLGLAYTLNDQILFYLPFQLFLKDRKYNFYGEFGYYRYNYFYFGNGNTFDDYEGELFGVSFPRVRINALYQVFPNLYTGIRYWMDDYQITEVEEEGLLNNFGIEGAQGGFISGLGLISQYDNRDRIFYPSKGWFAEFVFLHHSTVTGSEFEFDKWSLDVSNYQSFGNLIFAFNTYVEINRGNIPFNQLALLGGTKRLRGFYEGRFRDNDAAVFQSELRFPLFWRIGAVVFGGVGWVTETFKLDQTIYTRYTLGGGLRIILQKQEHVNLRIDYGIGPNTSGIYITVGEAF